ncbi:TetR/AcrR family transcriptional regulator [Acidicapsa ligni]|uniref:TetR/AcrR family transcriptional regulator n=1 Tax=Acidicapsa ligni TaxID=542300 RepID=UPI0021DFF014|nr:TetR/AcrR family transcriptional regulator [Acidicapsa ligni]
MPSVSSNPKKATPSKAVRRPPQQERSERTLAAILDVAAGLFAEVGFEATTMTAIAARSNTSIGGLYHYFPDKNSVVLALLKQYGHAIETEWKSLIDQAPGLTPQKFANIFIETMLRVVHQHPCYLALQTARVRFRRDPASRRALRLAIANAFRAKNPALTEGRAFLSANVVIQTVSGMTRLFAESTPEDQPIIVADYKVILTTYLTTILRG